MKGIYKQGKIHYPKEKLIEDVVLTEEYRIKIKDALIDMNKLLLLNSPPTVIKKGICKSCAYYEFCFSGED